MTPLTLLALGTQPNDLYQFAFVAALFVAGLTFWRRRAGLGCVGLALFHLAFFKLLERAVGWGVMLRSMLVVAVAFIAVDAIRRSREKRACEEEEAEHEAAVLEQRAAIPASARSLGFVYYEGGIPAMEPDEEVELLVAGNRLWLAPTDPYVPAVHLDCARLADLYVVEGTSNVVVALRGKRGRNQEVELSATADDSIDTARQLYAILDDALPAHGPPENSPAARRAQVCAGCGAPAPGETCAHCGRPT